MSGEPAHPAHPARETSGPRRWLLLPGWGFGPAVWDPTRARLPARLSVQALPLFSGAVGEAVATALADRRDGSETAGRAGGLAAAWVDALREQAAGRPVGLVGWSLGGLIALEWARRHPREVDALVLVATSPRFVQTPGWPHAMSRDDFAAFARLADGRAKAAFDRLCALSALGEPDPAAMARRLRALRCGEAAAGALAAGLSLLGESDLREAPALRQPVALLHAAGDALVPCGAAEGWSAHLPAARRLVLPCAGHAVPLAHAARVSDAIIALSGS